MYTTPVLSTESESLRKMVKIIYILNFVTIIFPVCSIVGVVLAYIFRDEAQSYLKSHFQFIIRGFWLSLLYYVIAGLLCLILIGYMLLVIVTLWWIIRNARGLKNALQEKAVVTSANQWI